MVLEVNVFAQEIVRILLATGDAAAWPVVGLLGWIHRHWSVTRAFFIIHQGAPHAGEVGREGKIVVCPLTSRKACLQYGTSKIIEQTILVVA